VTLSPSQAADLLARHGLAPSRALGQNFVVDPNTVRRIARLAGVGPDDHVVEIGAGLGSLTLALVETGAAITAVEVDHGIVPVLREQVEPLGVRVVEGDALTLDWAELLAGAPRWTLVANLPYNVATPLVADLLDGVPAISRLLVMVQREVGERFAALPRTPAYGAVSVKVAYWATASVVGRVPPTVFLPKPKVESALVSIVRRPEPAIDPAVVPAPLLFTLVRAGFGQRRKMLRNSLAAVIDPADLPGVFEDAGVDATARAEELDVVTWGRLAAAVAVRRGEAR
jgi:16S rRNA (adenine1518-N6/adenine1519-N6)-dimethyltransferase